MKILKDVMFFIVPLIFGQYVRTIEWFTKIKINSDNGNEIIYDKTIIIHEFFTQSKLKCWQKCLSFFSSCQFIQFNANEKCKIYSAINKSFLNTNENIYLREKKLPRVHFINGSFLDQKQLNNNFTNLTIDLFQSGLSLIVPYAFQNCQNILTLNVSSNNLTRIYSKSFYGMSKIKFLFMASNQISELESNIFQDVRFLYYLSLRNNLIKNLDDNLFDYSHELVIIRLELSLIECLHKGIFKNLIKLRYLYLSNNRLKVLEPWFGSLESLEFLDFSSNQISEIQNDTFKSMKKLKTLSIFSNQLSEINSHTFKGAHNLEILTIYANKIQGIYNNFSKDFKNLTQLSLSQNNLSLVEPGFLNGLVKLEILRLFDCNLKLIELSSLVNLKILSLAHNKITYFSEDLSLLTELYLNNNPLNNLSNPLISSQNSSLQTLDISNCVLINIDFEVLRNLSNLEILRISGNPITLNNQTFIGFKRLQTVFVNSVDVTRLNSSFPNIRFIQVG
ncbi:unnamed protein product [Brachionus calyciflorus]|uniref:Uncharacterized protein n=1 Tax=Brachionus calyciflorus TaxID=104777 RepID=A0A813YAC2_9BILA|nr:unnamed protein product [Brachionus calyciflorus]